jgi:MOSC domain-containing protein YiiM
MHVISVNVGLPRDVEWHGRIVRTAIFKEPVAGPVRVGGVRRESHHRRHGRDRCPHRRPSAHRLGRIVVTQPRTPCLKLAVRFGRIDMIKRFHLSGRSGFYLAVTREGHVQAGDEISKG